MAVEALTRPTMPTRIRHADPGAGRRRPAARRPSPAARSQNHETTKVGPQPGGVAAKQQNPPAACRRGKSGKRPKGRTSGHSPPPEPRNRVTSKSAFCLFAPAQTASGVANPQNTRKLGNAAPGPQTNENRRPGPGPGGRPLARCVLATGGPAVAKRQNAKMPGPTVPQTE